MNRRPLFAPNEQMRGQDLRAHLALVWGEGAQQVPPLRYRSGPNEQNWMGRICELTRRAFVCGKGALQIPPLRCASVGMTKGRVTVALGNCYWDGRKAGPSTALRFGRDDKFA